MIPCTVKKKGKEKRNKRQVATRPRCTPRHDFGCPCHLIPLPPQGLPLVAHLVTFPVNYALCSAGCSVQVWCLEQHPMCPYLQIHSLHGLRRGTESVIHSFIHSFPPSLLYIVNSPLSHTCWGSLGQCWKEQRISRGHTYPLPDCLR